LAPACKSFLMTTTDSATTSSDRLAMRVMRVRMQLSATSGRRDAHRPMAWIEAVTNSLSSLCT
jgi:hypothetical protein